jgi:integrase
MSTPTPIEAVDLYAAALEGTNGRAPVARSTADNIMRVVHNYTGHAIASGVRKLADNSTRTAAAWVEFRTAQVSTRTLNTELSYLQRYFRWLYRQGYTAAEVGLDEHRSRIATEEPTVIEDEQARRFVREQPTAHDAAVAYLMAATGMRRNEPLRLLVADYDRMNETLELRVEGVERTKRHGRVFPLAAEAIKAVEVLAADKSPERRLLDDQSATVRVCQRHKLHPKQLRQWFCSTLEVCEVPDYIINRLMGHAGSRVRRAYSGGYRLSQGRDAMAKVEAVLGAFNPTS